jgi:hypothetical protein
MKVVQTTISSEEHALLAACAHDANKTIKELLRQIIRSYLFPENVDSNDPFFTLRFKGKKDERGSLEHDKILYDY